MSAAPHRGITYIYIFLPIILMVFTLIAAKLFPMKKPEFKIIKREAARRKGEDKTK